MLTEKDIYCFKVILKHIYDDDCFTVSYNVLAEDRYKAKTIIEKWLSNPKQTGFKYECCVGIIPQPSDTVIISSNPPKTSLTEKQKILFEKMKDAMTWHGHTCNNDADVEKTTKDFFNSLGYTNFKFE